MNEERGDQTLLPPWSARAGGGGGGRARPYQDSTAVLVAEMVLSLSWFSGALGRRSLAGLPISYFAVM